MILIKVDIITGKVLVNNLRKFWKGMAREVRRNEKPAQGPVEYNTPEIDTELLEHLHELNRKTRQRSNTWSCEEMYTLIMMARQKYPYKEISVKLNHSLQTCRYMKYRLKKAGIV
ncbi:MAG: hypothetical protein K9L17_08980 [Clostridiales bacterium]|nr:hypothetical protein [Clostridiales bacterium]MCF8022810.1 hypothetical protein [Clostridiales bacterium]